MSDVAAALAGLATNLGSATKEQDQTSSHRRYLDVADGILAAVGAGHLSPGDRLPNERELARICNTSRTTVRDALLALELFGVVDVRPGSGCYISSLNSPRRMTSSVMLDAIPRELLEARLHVEPQVAAICAGKVSPPEVRRLRRLIAECEAEGERAAADDLSTFFKLSQEFHSELAGSCGNSILAEMCKQLADVATHPLWQVVNAMQLRDPAHRASQTVEHTEILDAVEQGDAELAAEKMHHHLTRIGHGIFSTIRLGTGIVRQPRRSR